MTEEYNKVKPYAVIFKTHFWDDFCDRQLKRLQQAAPSADVYIAIDETISKKVGNIGQNTIRIHESDIIELGLPMVTTDGSVIWYNIDYPHYIFQKKYPHYDYYIFVEYDVLSEINLDHMIDDLRKEQIGYVGYKIQKSLPDWPWHPMHQPIYGENYSLSLSCFSAFSSSALNYLLSRRQNMARDFISGALLFWPNNEAFLLTEVKRGGFKTDFLERFGDISQFDWWPPTAEATLNPSDQPRFIHPLLPTDRYVRSRIGHEPKFTNIINPYSTLYSVQLRGYPRKMVRSVAIAAIRARLKQSIISRLSKFGLEGVMYFCGAWV